MKTIGCVLSNIYYKQFKTLVWGCADLSDFEYISVTSNLIPRGVVLMERDLYFIASEKIAYFHTKLVSK